jgi:hypothetical protein
MNAFIWLIIIFERAVLFAFGFFLTAESAEDAE